MQKDTAVGWYLRPKKDTEPLSGTGSTTDSAKEIIEYLNEIKPRLPIDTLTDIPCGDWTWMSKVNLTGIKYLGLDIVPQLIERNCNFYPGIDFRVFDVLNEDIPKSDLIVCRDFFIHLTNQDVLKVIDNFKRSKSKYLLVSSYPAVINQHRDTIIGDYTRHRFAPINLEIYPFNLKVTERFFEKAKVCGNREMLLIDMLKD